MSITREQLGDNSQKNRSQSTNPANLYLDNQNIKHKCLSKAISFQTNDKESETQSISASKFQGSNVSKPESLRMKKFFKLK
mmetsp:Transcript_13457/g.11953  ORF Transcript_13457/g.11953 Transcript_13457/m.11953 type:complete len:81 (-) Transcript_13457:78-320(-)